MQRHTYHVYLVLCRSSYIYTMTCQHTRFLFVTWDGVFNRTPRAFVNRNLRAIVGSGIHC